MRAMTERGYTLVELVITVTIIAVIAAIAVPAFSSGSDQRLQLAAKEVASAIRYARSESIRTGEAHGLTISQATQKVTVNKYDLSTAPISVLYTLTHPINKQPYDFNVNTGSTTKGVTIGNTQDVFNFTGLGGRRSVIFDANGTPKWIVGSGPTTYLLSDASVELSYGNQQSTVSLTPITGRVIVQ